MDQLNECLYRINPEKYATSINGESLLCLGRKQDGLPKLCLFTLPYQTSSRIEEIKNIFNKARESCLLFKAGGKLADRLSVPFYTILFPNKKECEENDCFYVDNGTDKIHKKKSEELAIYLRKSLDVMKNDIPAKFINKRTSDYFHIWTRHNLPSGDDGIVKCDLDALFVSSCYDPLLLIEIKRSDKVPIQLWEPYKNDYSGLDFLKTIANRARMDFWILHHDTSIEGLLNTENGISSFFVNVKADNLTWEKTYPLSLSKLNEFILSDYYKHGIKFSNVNNNREGKQSKHQ